MRLHTLALVTGLLLLLLSALPTTAFHILTTSARPSTRQWGKKVKRSELGQLAADGIVSPKKTVAPPKKKSTKGGTVSPALAEWAKQAPESAAATEEPVDQDTTSDAAATFTSFKEAPKTSRRQKQSARKEEEKERQETVLSTLETLDELLQEKSGATLDDILGAIRPLIDLSSDNLRVLTAGAKQLDYRLAWVGGDDCLVHIGTGLHKVPLARMQEVFLTLKGRNRIELLEVIRILGPFPNVLNILQGDSKAKPSQPATEWEIVMDSMVDGTGKEILAGTEDNVRRVNLQVYFCDPNAILAVVPPESGLRDDPLQENGANVLLFVREDDLDAKLEMLRVAA